MGTELAYQARVTIWTLSPVHVGDGRGVLTEDVDFVRHRGRLYLIDLAKLWERLGDQELAHWNQLSFRLSALLQPAEYPACAAATYSVPEHLESGTGLIHPLTDAEGRPYLPGSSLKGAIRTALLRATGGPFDLATLEPSKSWAAQPIERRHFGKNPNFDLLRTLRIADSAPVDASRLKAVVVATYSLRGSRLEPKGPGYRLNVVALPARERLETTLSLDRWTLGQTKLDFGSRARWLDELAARCQQAATALIDAERRFFDEVGPAAIARFYADLTRYGAGLDQRSFLLPIGWGTGWMGKTLAMAIRDQPGFEKVRAEFKLGRLGAPFPKSRRLVEEAPNRPRVPPGWVQVTIKTATD